VIGILEGLISGLPCVVFDMPVLKAEVSETIKNNFVFVIPYGNIQEASKVIIEYDNYSKSKKNTLSKKARKFASKFDWNEIANKEFLVIKNLIK
jgi:glycosyltransferase involved in cell wall biosynthesis